MLDAIDRRNMLKAMAGAGLAGLFGSACASHHGDGLPIRIVSSQGTQVLTIQALMNRKGYFREFGLDPETMAVASGTNVIGPLVNQTADICIFAGFSQLLAAIEKGADLRIIGGASIKGQQALFSKNPAVRQVRDLVGRTVGVGAIGAQLHQVVVALLRKKGIDPHSVQFVTVGSSGDVFRAVVAERVDAGNGQADILSSLNRLGVHMLSDGDYAVELPEYTWQASFSSTAAIRDKRETLVRTLAAYCKAFRYVQNAGSRDDFVAAQLEALHPRDQAEATERAVSQWNYLQQRKIYAEDLVISEERVRYMQQLNVDLGVQRRILPYEQVIDLSLAHEAVARLH